MLITQFEKNERTWLSMDTQLAVDELIVLVLIDQQMSIQVVKTPYLVLFFGMVEHIFLL